MNCKKLVYKTGDSEPYDKKVLFGVIKEETDTLLIFRTAKKEYRISKSLILILEDTDREFVGWEK